MRCVRHPFLIAVLYFPDDSHPVHGSVLNHQLSDDDSDSPPPESLRRIKEIAQAKMEQMKQRSKSYDVERSKVVKKQETCSNGPRSGMILFQN